MSAQGGTLMDDEGGDYHHVRFRDPDSFSEIRTPDWAAHVAESVVPGSEVRTGRTGGDDEWQIESVLLPKDRVERGQAVNAAREIVGKVES